MYWKYVLNSIQLLAPQLSTLSPLLQYFSGDFKNALVLIQYICIEPITHTVSENAQFTM